MQNWTLTNKQYDILKWVISIFLPALIAFAALVMGEFNWEHTETFLKISLGFEVFLGSIFKLSDSNYNKNKEEN